MQNIKCKISIWDNKRIYFVFYYKYIETRGEVFHGCY